jgi:hypothetical protein
MGQSIADHLKEGAEQTKAGSEKLQRRAAARKINKIIKNAKRRQKQLRSSI